MVSNSSSHYQTNSTLTITMTNDTGDYYCNVTSPVSDFVPINSSVALVLVQGQLVVLIIVYIHWNPCNAIMIDKLLLCVDIPQQSLNSLETSWLLTSLLANLGSPGWSLMTTMHPSQATGSLTIDLCSWRMEPMLS